MSLKSITDKIVNLDEIILEEANARRTAKQLAKRINILGTSYYVLEDGRLTTEDGKILAQGIIQHMIIANEARIMTQLSVRGALTFGSTLVGGLAIVYGAGVTVSYLIDPENGVKNFHEFLHLTRDNPSIGVTVGITSGVIVGQHIVDEAPKVIDATEQAIGQTLATNPAWQFFEPYIEDALLGLFLGEREPRF